MTRRTKVLGGLFLTMLLVAGGVVLFSADMRAAFVVYYAPGDHRADQLAQARRARQAGAATRPRRAPASRPAAAVISTPLLQELPRQALFITAAHEFGLPASDRSVDFAGTTEPLPLACRVDYRFGMPAA